MKRYIRASITSEVNDIVNNRKDVKVHVNETSPCRNEEDVWYQVRNDNIENLEVTKYEPGDPDYQKYHAAFRADYQGPCYVGRWNTYFNYNATKNEELINILKRLRTFDELKEFYRAIENIGDGTWFYTKRNNNPVEGFYESTEGPEYTEYLVDRHSTVLKCKISNLYKVLKIY